MCTLEEGDYCDRPLRDIKSPLSDGEVLLVVPSSSGNCLRELSATCTPGFLCCFPKEYSLKSMAQENQASPLLLLGEIRNMHSDSSSVAKHGSRCLKASSLDVEKGGLWVLG